MTRILILLAGLVFTGESFALPPCPTSGYRDNCFGTYTYDKGEPEGGEYVGEYKDDKWHGHGTYTYGKGEREGHKYVGEYKAGKWHGHGTYKYANGNKYVGEYKNNKQHGHGTFTYGKGEREGDKYVGEYKDDKWHGQGTYKYANGNKYVGEWRDGMMHGHGTYTSPDGNKYVGEFKDGKRHGLGTSTKSNGNKYVGEWRDGKRNGRGTFTFGKGGQGSKYVGEWQKSGPWNGIVYSASGQVQRIYSNGTWCVDCKPTARLLAIVGEINSGQLATIQSPQQQPTLIVKSNPVSADVYIDNAYKGQTELTVQLAPDHYSIRVSKNGYNNRSQQIELDKNMMLLFSLSKTKESKSESGRKLIGTGTGFVVNKYYVVTAEHVLEDCNAVSIVHGHNKLKAKTVARDASNDLGLIRVQEPFGNTAKLRGGKRVRLGEIVANFGYPLFGQLSISATITEGNINNLSGPGNNSTVLQFDAPTQPGNSGGALLDSSGNVVGVAIQILSKKYADATGHIAQNVNFAVKSSIVEGFLQSNKVPYEKADSTAKLELTDIAEKAERFTVLVGCWE